MNGRAFSALAALLLFACMSAPGLGDSAPAIVGDGMPQPLTGLTANPADGKRVFSNRDAGHCVLCHRVATLPVTFQGDLGPDLSSVGARLTPAQLRLRIVDASLLNPRTIMPPYYRTRGLSQVASDYRNKPVLTALQVEQLVSYLASLQE